jgi:branched-chain amino acid transport system substrate-binding protein
MKRFWFGLLIVAVVVTGCAPKPAAPTPTLQPTEIKIGVYLPATGPFAAGGQMEYEGIKFAAKLYPEVLGKKITLVFCDNKSDKVEAATCMSRLIEAEKVVAVLGTYGSSLAIAAGEVSEKAKIPVLGTSPTNPLVTKGRKYYFRVCFIDPFQGAVGAKFTYETLKARKVAILFDIAQDAPTGEAMYFRDAWKTLAGDVAGIVGWENYRTGDSDFTAQLTHIKSLNVDAVYLPGYYGEAALAIKQAREMGITIPFVGPDGWDAPEFLSIGGTAVNGCFMTTHYAAEAKTTNAAVDFVAKWKAAYNRDPAALEAIGYDTYMTMRHVIEKAGKADPELIRAGLEGLTGSNCYEGVTSMICLDANHDAIKSAVIMEVKDGAFKYIETVAPVTQ